MLYSTGISPIRKFKDISDKEWRELYLDGRKLMRKIVKILDRKEFKYESKSR